MLRRAGQMNIGYAFIMQKPIILHPALLLRRYRTSFFLAFLASERRLENCAPKVPNPQNFHQYRQQCRLILDELEKGSTSPHKLHVAQSHTRQMRKLEVMKDDVESHLPDTYPEHFLKLYAVPCIYFHTSLPKQVYILIPPLRTSHFLHQLAHISKSPQINIQTSDHQPKMKFTVLLLTSALALLISATPVADTSITSPILAERMTCGDPCAAGQKTCPCGVCVRGIVRSSRSFGWGGANLDAVLYWHLEVVFVEGI